MEEKTGPKDGAEVVAKSPARLTALFGSFLKIGAFTFGGGWAMVPLIRKELVQKKAWIGDSEFVDLLAIAQSAPGPIAINTAVITGYKIRGIGGALASAFGAALPSFLVILAFATVLVRLQGSQTIEAVFRGMRPAIFGLLISAVWQVGRNSVKTRIDVVYAAIAAILLLALKVSPIAVVGIAAVAGIVMGRVRPKGTPEEE